MFAAVDLKRRRVQHLEEVLTARQEEFRHHVDRFKNEQSHFAEESRREKESANRQLQERLEKIRVFEGATADGIKGARERV